jgi:hypothetical protein
MALGKTTGMVVVAFCQRRWRRCYYDDINVQSNHLCGKFRKSIRMALRVPAFDDEIPAFRITQFRKALEHRIIKFLVSLCDKPHPPNLARLLSQCSERPSSRPDTYKCYEIAPSHFPSEKSDKVTLWNYSIMARIKSPQRRLRVEFCRVPHKANESYSIT